MEIISKANKIISSIVGEQKYSLVGNYKKSTYIITFSENGVNFVFNTLTDELLLLTKEEYDQFSKGYFNDEVFKEKLVKYWYLVDETFDESLLLNQAKSTIKLLDSTSNKKNINSFTILTTTNCNARCFYCFEAGRSKINMSEQTARQTAKFIKCSCKDTPARIQWFGGEPLCNEKVIDIISQQLSNEDIDFSSTMTTNAYLFNENNVKKAKELWNLTTIKVTLDGTEEIYNKVKNYVNCNINAFDKVLNNIELLLNNGIKVVVRLNVDEHNAEDLFYLIDQLYIKFSSYKNFSIYPHALFHYEKNICQDFDNSSVIMKCRNLQKALFDKNLLTIPSHYNISRSMHCMADSDSATVILPDGKLGKCEYYTDGENWGSLYDTNVDYSIIEKYKELINKEECKKCSFAPICSYIKNCPNVTENICALNYELKLDSIKYWALTKYKQYLSKNISEYNGEKNA